MQNSMIATLGRLLLASLFLFSGIAKITNPEGVQAYISAAGLPFPLLAYLIAIVIEVGGGVLLVVGFKTHLVAAVMAIFTLVAAVAFHHKFGDMGQLIHFFKDLAITGGLLQVMVFGAGTLSVDARISKQI